MPTVKGTIVSQRRDRKGFKLDDDEWYSSFETLSGVDLGDVVEFEYVAKGRWKNIKGKINKVSGGSGSSSGGGGEPPARKNFNVGVEVGHAWNSAVQIVLATDISKDREQILRDTADLTARVYSFCRELRKFAEEGSLEGAEPVETPSSATDGKAPSAPTAEPHPGLSSVLGEDV